MLCVRPDTGVLPPSDRILVGPPCKRLGNVACAAQGSMQMLAVRCIGEEVIRSGAYQRRKAQASCCQLYAAHYLHPAIGNKEMMLLASFERDNDAVQIPRGEEPRVVVADPDPLHIAQEGQRESKRVRCTWCCTLHVAWCLLQVVCYTLRGSVACCVTRTR